MTSLADEYTDNLVAKIKARKTTKRSRKPTQQVILLMRKYLARYTYVTEAYHWIATELFDAQDEEDAKTKAAEQIEKRRGTGNYEIVEIVAL